MVQWDWMAAVQDVPCLLQLVCHSLLRGGIYFNWSDIVLVKRWLPIYFVFILAEPATNFVTMLEELLSNIAGVVSNYELWWRRWSQRSLARRGTSTCAHKYS